jgi:hypothetical protein
MTTSDHQDDNAKLPDFGPNVSAPPATAPKPGSKARRWLKLGLLGVGLAGIYIAFNLSLLTVPVAGPPIKPKSAPNEVNLGAFKLTDDKLQKQLVLVIQSQLAAFRQEDYSAAYAFAAADFKAQVPLAAFERLVKAAFPQIARSRSAEYGIILDNGEDARVEVTIVGESGTRIHYQYVLHREHGGWKIGGVNEGQTEKNFI